MSIHAPDPKDLSESVEHLLSLGLTQMSIQATLSTSLTASALGLATLATALTSTILTVQGAIAPHWQWALLPSIGATVTGLLATAAGDVEHVGREDLDAVFEMAANRPSGVGLMVLANVQRTFFKNDRALQGKRRLIVATFGWLLASGLSIGILNLGAPTTLG